MALTHSLSAALTFNLPESNVCIASIAYIQRYRSSAIRAVAGDFEAPRAHHLQEEKAVAADPN
jgi:hypothetical protein